jgi:hypothetical protein
MTVATRVFQNIQPNTPLQDQKSRVPINQALQYLSGTLQADIDTAIAAALATSASTRPTFSAHKNGTNQTGIVSATPTKITFGTAAFDVGGYLASSTYTPLVAGKYLLLSAVRWTNANAVDGEQMEISLYKNGSVHKTEIWPRSGTGFQQTSLTAIVEANGSTDFFEVYGTKNGAGDGAIQGVDSLTYFQGVLVA